MAAAMKASDGRDHRAGTAYDTIGCEWLFSTRAATGTDLSVGPFFTRAATGTDCKCCHGH